MNNESRSTIQRLQDVNVYMTVGGNFNSTYNNYSGFIDQMRDVNYGPAGKRIETIKPYNFYN